MASQKRRHAAKRPLNDEKSHEPEGLAPAHGLKSGRRLRAAPYLRHQVRRAASKTQVTTTEYLSIFIMVLASSLKIFALQQLQLYAIVEIRQVCVARLVAAAVLTALCNYGKLSQISRK